VGVLLLWLVLGGLPSLLRMSYSLLGMDSTRFFRHSVYGSKIGASFLLKLKYLLIDRI
jgi:hypothetical protein